MVHRNIGAAGLSITHYDRRMDMRKPATSALAPTRNCHRGGWSRWAGSSRARHYEG